MFNRSNFLDLFKLIWGLVNVFTDTIVQIAVKYVKLNLRALKKELWWFVVPSASRVKVCSLANVFTFIQMLRFVDITRFIQWSYTRDNIARIK